MRNPSLVLAWALAIAGCSSSSSATAVTPSPDAPRAAPADAPPPDAPPGSPAADAPATRPIDAGIAADGGPAETMLEASFLGGLHVFAVDPRSGNLTEAAGSPVDPHGALYGLALDPTGRDVYVVDLNADLLLGFRRSPGGTALTPLDPPSVATAHQPETLAVDPMGRFVYVGTFDGHLSVYERKQGDGSLAEIKPPLALAAEVTSIAPDAAGHFVYVQTGTGIHVYAVGGAGGLTEIDHSPFTVAFGGALVFHPNGKLLFNGGGALNVLAVDPASGALHPVDGSPFTTDVGSDPFSLDVAVDPTGRFVYAVHTFTAHVSGFSIDVATGKLTPVPHSPVDAAPSPYSLVVDPSGKLVYVGNDDADLITAFAIDAESGELKRIDHPPFEARGLQPEMIFAP